MNSRKKEVPFKFDYAVTNWTGSIRCVVFNRIMSHWFEIETNVLCSMSNIQLYSTRSHECFDEIQQYRLTKIFTCFEIEFPQFSDENSSIDAWIQSVQQHQSKQSLMNIWFDALSNKLGNAICSSNDWNGPNDIHKCQTSTFRYQFRCVGSFAFEMQILIHIKCNFEVLNRNIYFDMHLPSIDLIDANNRFACMPNAKSHSHHTFYIQTIETMAAGIDCHAFKRCKCEGTQNTVAKNDVGSTDEVERKRL